MDVTYQKLPGDSCIRLLQLQTSLFSRELSGSFKIVPVDDHSLEYTAVSYTWGDSTPVARIKFRDGRLLPISQTLFDLFEILRLRGQKFTLWIDSLCINQVDLEEKAAQVKIMGKVYSSASQVLLWLGAGTPQSKAAFRYMNSKQTLSWPEDWENEKDLSGLEDVFLLLSRPWFQRVWVVQEITLSDNVLVVCGNDHIDFDNFRHCVFAVWKFYEDLIDFDEDDPALRGLWSITRLIFIRDDFQTSGAVPYETLLEAAFHLQATEKQDMVFAFQSIADKGRPVPEPDYTVPVEQIYRETAIALLCHGTSLDLLALGGIARERGSDLPSWVPDLRHFSYSEPFASCNRAGWNAGGDLKVRPKVVQRNQLQLQVRKVDIVDMTCPVFKSWSVGDQKAALTAVLALRERLPSKVSEEAWMNMLASSLIFGLDIEDDPAGPEYYDYFKEWLAWLQSSSSEADLENIRSNKFQRTIGPRIDGWKGFITKGGLFCIGPPCVEKGDIIQSTPGCRLPIIMRQDKEASDDASPPAHTLVSWCFVQNIMFGEGRGRQGAVTEVLLR